MKSVFMTPSNWLKVSMTMNKEQVLKELLERRQFWDYELENLEKLNRTNDRELRGAIAGIDVAIQLVKEIQ